MEIKIRRQGPGVRQVEPVGDGKCPDIRVPTAFVAQVYDLADGFDLSLKVTAADGQFRCDVVTIARRSEASGITKAGVDRLPLNQIIELAVAEAAIAYGERQGRRRLARVGEDGGGRQRRRRRDVDDLALRLYTRDTALRLAGVKQSARVVRADLAERGVHLHRNYVAELIRQGAHLSMKEDT